MKNFLLILLVSCSSIVLAQNEIITPAGQPLKVSLLNVSSGKLMLNNLPFLRSSGTGNIFLGELSGQAVTTGINNTFFGFESGSLAALGNNNTLFGSKAGRNAIGQGNTFFGTETGLNNAANFNAFIGNGAGKFTTTGGQNVFIGYSTGALNTIGTNNVFVGNSAGNENSSGKWNTYIGHASTNANISGERNTNLGAYSGSANITGSGNVFIGYRAGQNETGSNKLYIANTAISTPLIYGDFSTSRVVLNGKVGAGTSNFPISIVDGSSVVHDLSNFYLFVKGGLLTEKVVVANGWADYVFEENYKLKPLSEVERFITDNGHLPNVPSARKVEEHGLDLGDMTRIQQEKIEELTLYVIDLEKRLKMRDQDIEKLTSLVQQVINKK